MKQVYILTEEGRSYSQEGLDYLGKEIRDRYEETESLEFVAGGILNNPKEFATMLEENPTSYIVVSMAGSIKCIYGSNIQAMREALLEQAQASSWEIAVRFLQ